MPRPGAGELAGRHDLVEVAQDDTECRIDRQHQLRGGVTWSASAPLPAKTAAPDFTKATILTDAVWVQVLGDRLRDRSVTSSIIFSLAEMDRSWIGQPDVEVEP